MTVAELLTILKDADPNSTLGLSVTREGEENPNAGEIVSL
jgi:hypothetical protein